MSTKYYGFVFVIMFLQASTCLNLVFTHQSDINSEHDGTMAVPRWPLSTLLTQNYKRQKRQVKPQCSDDDGFPFELHIPGYRFCGPGTKYLRNTKHEVSPKNALDAACMNHDAIYTHKCKDFDARSNADKRLLRISSRRVMSADASFGERASAVLVAAILSFKVTFQNIGSLIGPFG